MNEATYNEYDEKVREYRRIQVRLDRIQTKLNAIESGATVGSINFKGVVALDNQMVLPKELSTAITLVVKEKLLERKAVLEAQLAEI